MLDINFDTREFNDTLRKYAEQSSKELDQIVLEKSQQIAFEALKQTHHADPGKIARELAQSVAETQVTAKNGKIRIKRKLNFGVGDPSTLAARIVNARRRRNGEPPLWGQKLTQAAQKLTQARIRSVNFVRSGWIPSIKRLAARLGRGGNTGGVKQKGASKGYATINTGKFSPAVEIVNTAMNTLPKGDPNNDPAGMQRNALAGLQRAVTFVTRDMVVYIERKLQRVADRHNAR